jgi:hypothetical protein
MDHLPYSFEPAPGLVEYKVSAMLRDYLALLMGNPENQETIEQILKLVNGYTDQLRNLRIQNPIEATKEVYKAIDGFFDVAPEGNKKDIQCKTGCTACCFIDIDVSIDEAAVINNYCRENGIEIDRDYLIRQAAVGRKSFSDLSKCVFLKDNLCSIYPVRPIACRKHWVKTDPALCDFSKNIINQVGGYFDVNTEILASAALNVKGAGPFEKIMLNELDNI